MSPWRIDDGKGVRWRNSGLLKDCLRNKACASIASSSSPARASPLRAGSASFATGGLWSEFNLEEVATPEGFAREAVDETRLAEARAKMGPGEEEILMYGQRFWPVIDNRMGVYDDSTLCLAIWHFQDQLRWVSNAED